MPTGTKTKNRNDTIYFDSHWTTGVDHHHENEVSSRENGEKNEEDSDHETESESDSESDESSTDDDDKED